MNKTSQTGLETHAKSEGDVEDNVKQETIVLDVGGGKEVAIVLDGNVDAEKQNRNEDGNVDVEKQNRNDDEEKGIQDRDQSWLEITACIVGALACLYVFLVGLTVMGSSFKVLAGHGASKLFTAINNPIAGLMVGILATVLVQSSSTSTSIVVTLVATDIIGVSKAIPIIMGANIGTSVTNTFVALASMGNRLDYQRAFAGATVHDMFNILTVITLLPLEVIIGAMQGTGGPLYWLTNAIAGAAMSGEKGGKLFTSPVKTICSPVANFILKSNKYVIYGATLPKPTPLTPTRICQQCKPMAGVTTENCTARRLQSDEAVGLNYSRSLLSKRALSGAALNDVDCSEYACVSPELGGYFKKASKSDYSKMVSCKDALPSSSFSCGGGDSCYMLGTQFYGKHIENGKLLSGGFLKADGLGEVAGGIFGLLISIVLLCCGMIGLCKLLQRVFLSKAKAFIKYSVRLNGYVAILVGWGITIIVQSSSVTTSALTPVCALGVIPLHKMLPLTLGANIGTTCTALIASLVDLKRNGVQIALCHLFFNIFGILLWFPVPMLRQVPLKAAHTLGLYASFYKSVPMVYILVSFVLVPAVALGVSLAFGAHIALGVILLLLVVGALATFELWWWKGIPLGNPGSLKVLSAEQRVQSASDLLQSNAKIMGVTVEEYEEKCQLSWWG